MIFEGRGSFLIGFEGFLPGFRVRHLSRIRVLFRGRNPRARVLEQDVQVARLEMEREGLLDMRRSLPDFKTVYFFE